MELDEIDDIVDSLSKSSIKNSTYIDIYTDEPISPYVEQLLQDKNTELRTTEYEDDYGNKVIYYFIFNRSEIEPECYPDSNLYIGFYIKNN